MTSPSPYGIIARASLERDYRPITAAQHKASRWRAIPPHDVLVESVEGQPGMVRLLPRDARPYAWRTLWRKHEEGTPGLQHGPAEAQDATHAMLDMSIDVERPERATGDSERFTGHK